VSTVVIWGKKARGQFAGVVKERICPSCQQPSHVLLYRVQSRFHLFWIPVTPWRSTRHYLIECDQCRMSADLNRRERDQILANMAEAGR
jgi:hypothetical protein